MFWEREKKNGKERVSVVACQDRKLTLSLPGVELENAAVSLEILYHL